MHCQADALSSIQECPTFAPTKEEFIDPIFYISKIRPIGEKTGIVKIKPPSDWSPPFCRDPEKFQFAPRIQCLRELEGVNRMKLNFTDNFIHFWDLHGQKIVKPVVGGQSLDLYQFFDLVNREGGYHQVCAHKLWSGIGRQLGLTTDVQWSSVLKEKYRKLLYPFEYFIKVRCILLNGEKLNPVMYTSPRNLIRPLFPLTVLYDEVITCAVETQSKKTPTIETPHCPTPEVVPPSGESAQNKEITCRACYLGDEEEVLLICEACEVGFHTFCLYPPLDSVPPGDWRCPGCIHKLYTPSTLFGFEHTKFTLSLNSFSYAANCFKRNYFEHIKGEVSCREVEKEFWSLLASIDSQIEVHYGADLHSSYHGSGFPCDVNDCEASKHSYIESGWNLNNIAYLEGCVLKHVPGDVSGLKKPWLYVGMCFSTFCWHVEDHWNHSINYLHWGEPKTWYGIPPYAADKFENCVKDYVPGLVANDPQLLHHLVTMIPPSVLLDYGVPVFRADQREGEFMVTFPRAYHAGFNQGFNFAEAVNFATKDWLKIGRECVQVYKKMLKPPIFSHNELICRCFASPQTPGSFAPSLFEDIQSMVTEELEARKRVFQTPMEPVQANFELMADASRNCHKCKTVLFLSSIVCGGCNSTRLCLEDLDESCPCGSTSRIFQYRYSGQELLSILESSKKKAEQYNGWLQEVENALTQEVEKPHLEKVEQLSERGMDLNCDGDTLTELQLIIDKAKLVSKKIQQLLSKRTKTKHSGSVVWIHELSDIERLAQEIESIPCIIPLALSIQRKLLETNTMFNTAKQLIDTNSIDVDSIEEVLYLMKQQQVHSPLYLALSDRLRVASWLRDYSLIYERCNQNKFYKPAFSEVQKILSVAHSLPITCQEVQTSVVWLNESISQANRWLKLSRTPSNGKYKRSLEILQNICNENEKLMISVPIPEELSDAIRDSEAWKHSYSNLSPSPTLSQVEQLIEDAFRIPVLLPELDALKKISTDASNWKYFLNDLFLIEGSDTNLLFSLLPRSTLPPEASDLQTLTSTMDSLNSRSRHTQHQESQLLVSLSKQELSSIRDTRKSNMEILHVASSPTPPLDIIICVTCGKRASEQMIFCNRCLALQHGPCAGLSLSNIEVTQNTFVCGRCVRTKRPTLSEAKTLLGVWNVDVSSPYTRALQLLVERGEKWESESSSLLNSFQSMEMETDTPLNPNLVLNRVTPPFYLSPHYKTIEDHLVEGLSIELVLERTSECVELWREAYRQRRLSRGRGKKGTCPTSKADSPQTEKSHIRNPPNLASSQSNTQSESRTENSSDDTCAALKCICLQEENVDWIQCDTCEAWFHFICVGLTQPEVNTMGDYTCPTCSKCKTNPNTNESELK